MIHKQKSTLCLPFFGITISSALIPLSRFRDNGLINNGSRKDDDPSRKPSVLEKLEEKKQEAVLLQQNAAKPEKSRSKDIDLG